TDEPAFALGEALAPEPELIPLLALDAETFRARFRGSAIKRAKRDGFVRNVAVALGNSADRRAIPALRASPDDPPAPARGRAALAALEARLPFESDPWVREELTLALSAAR